MNFNKIICLGLLLTLVFGCKSDPKPNPATNTPTKRVKVPAFVVDSAYNNIVKQLDFGYRTPGTKEHEACKDWLVSELKRYGAKTMVQDFKATIFNGTEMPGYNIMGQFNPKHKKRILLAAHWDSRLMAEKDPDQSRRNDPIYGADDGASGVGALLEIARLIQLNPIDYGIDIMFFDIEDQGDPDGGNETWALGSQHWSKNLMPKNYTAENGILLDMIGAKGAVFGWEAYSMQYNRPLVEKVWKLAKNMGYAEFFQDFNAQGIMDDHYWVNFHAKIPMIDIINRPLKTKSGFGDYHHTHKDNLEIIDKRPLRATGQVVTAAIYKMSDGSL